MKPRQWIAEHGDFVFFIIPFSFFALIGFVALYFAIRFPTRVPFAGWITIILFIIIPSIMIKGLIFGFSISEKQQRQIDERKDNLFFDYKGITIEMPLFDKSCFISWQSIEDIIYYNYIV